MAIPRAKCLSTKVTTDEYAMFEVLAGEHSVSEWARAALLHAARRRAAEQVLLEEVLALRTILLNVHFAVATGMPLTADEMRQLIDRADDDKAQKALERFTMATGRRSR
jgi:hypothetical protein